MKRGVVFHTIRFIDKLEYYSGLEDSGQDVNIFVKTVDRNVAIVKVIGIATIKIKDLKEMPWLIRADTYPHWDYEVIYKRLEKWYWRKDEWKGEDTEMIIVFMLPKEVWTKL